MRALDAFRGEYLQMPPPYSAKKVDGIRAYALARRDEPVALKAVPVRVSRLELDAVDDNRAVVRLTCSAGFYVRSLAHALGQAVGTGACLEALRRTRSGDFSLEAAVYIDELCADPEAASGWIVPLDGLLPRLPAVTVSDEGRMRVSHGRQLEAGHYSSNRWENDEWVRILDTDGQLLALGQRGPRPDSLHPSVVLI
jgi:tRNA pseudouridine55 synthase